MPPCRLGPATVNPALLLLALLAACGFVLRGERRLAWILACLLGTLLVAPALRLPTGVPSPAASLGVDAPWQGALDPRAGNPILGDVTYQVQPWLIFARDEIRAGRWPFWNPFVGAGTPFWGGNEAIPFFPLHALFVALPLQLGLVFLPWARIALAALGCWTLARQLGVGWRGAALATATFALSGMVTSFALFPMGSALALVPWVLWAVERLASAGRWEPLALLAGLQLLAGHPETCAHTALLAAVYLLVRGTARPLPTWARLTGAWLLAGGIAAVAILPLARLLPLSSRWQAMHGVALAEPPLGLLLAQPLRLLLPDLYGNPAHGTWWGPFNYVALASYAGALALPLAAAALPLARRDRRWRAIVVVLLLCFGGAYHLPGVREALGTLPVVGMALHHRLIFGIELCLALLAGAGLERWLEGGGRRALWLALATVAAALGAAWWRFAPAWRLHQLTGRELAWSCWALLAPLLLLAGRRLGVARQRALAPLLVAIAVADLVAAHGATNPALPAASLYPVTPAVQWLREHAATPGAGRIAGVGSALRPNASAVYRLFDVRIDDPLKLAAYERVNAELGAAHPNYFRPIRNWRSPWLDRLGVRWVIGPPGQPPPIAAWHLVYDGADARVFERSGGAPLVRWAGEGNPGARRLAVVRWQPGLWRLRYRAAAGGRVEVAETWSAGWSAQADGRALAVERSHGSLLAVDLPAGAGAVTLRYTPPGFVAGAALSALCLALGLLLAASAYRKRRRTTSANMRQESRTGRTRDDGESCHSTPTSTTV